MSASRSDLVQHLYTVTPNAAPPANWLKVGEIGIELADPAKLWVGVPTDMDATGRKMLFNAANITGGPWLPLTGGTLTGMLTLASDPTAALHAATKQYVDSHVAVGGPFLPLTGGTLTGPLTVTGSAPAAIIIDGPATSAHQFIANVNGAGRWVTIYNANTNGDFILRGVRDSGTGYDAITIERATENVTINTGNLGVSGILTAGLVQTTVGTGNGYVQLNAGGASNTGYVSFFPASGPRQGYIGFSDGTSLNISVDSMSQLLISAPLVKASTNLSVGGGASVGGGLNVAGDTVTHNLYCDSSLGILFRGLGLTYWMAFNWDGTNVPAYANGGYCCTLVSSTWVGNNFKNISAYTPNQNVDVYQSPTFTNTSLSGRLTCNDIMNVTGNFYVANNFAYYFQRSSSDGYWRWVSNGNVDMTLVPGGALILPYGVNPDISGNFQIRGDGSYRYFTWSPGWGWSWNISNGLSQYSTPGGTQWQFNISDWSAGNFAGYVFGVGAFVNVSDERTKVDIAEAPHGLDHILALRPITFRRVHAKTKKRHDRTELGFSAQQLRDILPEAVVSMNAPEEWRGVADSLMGMAVEPVVAALVNAIKTLNARLATLEAKGTA